MAIYFPRFLFIASVLAVASSGVAIAQPAIAQSSPQRMTPTAKFPPRAPARLPVTTKKTIRVVFNPPRGDAPSRTRSGASRGEVCFDPKTANSSQFMAIAPPSATGLTVSSHPTFFVYLPPTTATRGVFSLRDEQNNVVYQMTVPLQTVDQLVAIPLPKNAPALAIGSRYRWMLAVLCANKLEPGSPIASSWVTRVSLTTPSPPQAATPLSLEYAAFYGSQGLWYDMLAALAHQRRLHPDDVELMSNWQEILAEVGLNEIAEAPIAVQ
jgi:Domain of Unknown Function (DUF928)